jgi:hypothetical protein
MISKKLISQMRHTAVVAVFGVLTAGSASAALLNAFSNGGFEGYVGNTNSFNSNTPPGWTTTAGTPDVFNAGTTMSNFKWVASSTGGDFLHGIGWDGRPGAPYVESALQVGLTGLVIGQQYEISFEQSISNSDWSQGGGYWEIVFGTESHGSALMDLPVLGTADAWTWQTMIFTAANTIQTLEVVAHSTPATSSSRADLGIDSFFLGDPGTNPNNPDTPPTNNVPEPLSLALVGIGLAGIVAARRKKSSS